MRRNAIIITPKGLADKLYASRPHALAAINQLVEAGILIERTGSRRDRVFAAEAVLGSQSDLRRAAEKPVEAATRTT